MRSGLRSEKDGSRLLGSENSVPFLVRKIDRFIHFLEAYPSTDFVEDSLVRCDVADPYWRVLHHAFCLILPLSRRESPKRS